MPYKFEVLLSREGDLERTYVTASSELEAKQKAVDEAEGYPVAKKPQKQYPVSEVSGA